MTTTTQPPKARAARKARIIPFPKAKLRLIDSPPAEPRMTHGIHILITGDELDGWGRAASSAGMTFSAWGLATMRKAAAKPARQSMGGQETPAGDSHRIAVMFTEADARAFRARAAACGTTLETWAREVMKAACAA